MSGQAGQRRSASQDLGHSAVERGFVLKEAEGSPRARAGVSLLVLVVHAVVRRSQFRGQSMPAAAAGGGKAEFVHIAVEPLSLGCLSFYPSGPIYMLRCEQVRHYYYSTHLSLINPGTRDTVEGAEGTVGLVSCECAARDRKDAELADRGHPEDCRSGHIHSAWLRTVVVKRRGGGLKHEPC